MKKIMLLTALCFFGVSMVVYANKNEDNAKKYCREMMKKNPDHECKVSSWRGCGAGWTLDKTFRGRGKDYFACKRTKYHEKREEGREKHYRECREFCERNPDCVGCHVQLAGCPAGQKVGKRWTGVGWNYVACFLTGYGEASKANKKACETWCKNHKCKKCDTKPGCGFGYKTGKTFGGKGKNYYACF